ncbi:MAG: diaminopimelate decarboxylase [Candidatus Staskawiczbacteria bacterium]|nr:diaminopimelate decarboxylase [Candidatus Staskawiczbacteria bacterium]
MLPIPGYFRRDVYRRLPELVKRFGPTFHLYHKPGIIRTGKVMNAAFAGLNYRQYFAVKALPEPWIMRFLFEELGFGFDCSSVAELMLARGVGASDKDIMFTSNDTSLEEFECASADGGCILNLDDITFIPLVPKFPETVCFRINPGKLRKGGAIIGEPYKSKYGITYGQIIPAYAAAMGCGAKHFGLHTMICSNERHSSYFVETTRSMLEVAAHIYRKLVIRIEFINIGGGFGIPYLPTDPELHLEWIGGKISKLFRDFHSQYGWMPSLFTECGRFVTGPHGILVNPVLHVMQKYRHFIGVAAAMTGCPRPAFYGAHHHIDVLSPDGKLRSGPRHLANVVGPKCENWDRLTPVDKERLLPKSVRRGDILVAGNAGAHSGAMADNYNGRTRIAGLLDQDGTNKNVVMIRRAEKVGDLFRAIVFPPGLK